MTEAGESTAVRGLQVRGTVDVEKFKAARALGGEQVTFELHAIRPAKIDTEAVPDLSSIPCVVCTTSSGVELGRKNLPTRRD